MSDEHFFDANSDSDERLLGRQLKRAAREERPEFSANLHARIMGVIEARTSAETVSPAKPRAARRTVASWAAIAAGLLVAVGGAAALWNALGPSSQSPRQLTVAVTPAANPNTATPIENPPAAAKPMAVADNSPYLDFSLDDLNQTASQAVRLVVDQLPIEVPTDGWDFSSAE